MRTITVTQDLYFERMFYYERKQKHNEEGKRKGNDKKGQGDYFC